MRHSMKQLQEKNENLFEEVKVLRKATIAADQKDFLPNFDTENSEDLALELERRNESYEFLKDEFH